MALLAVRHTSRQIAERLGPSVRTVNNTLARAYAKLGVTGRAQLRTLLGMADDRPAATVGDQQAGAGIPGRSSAPGRHSPGRTAEP
ncbi:LuxR family transcriptional regulator [Micromonospora sp. HM5-17]|nr:LuxR family transcriptional regulator [Micromonospora sp. HM5-17]